MKSRPVLLIKELLEVSIVYSKKPHLLLQPYPTALLKSLHYTDSAITSCESYYTYFVCIYTVTFHECVFTK